jgi:hypothetical protein
MGIAVDFKDLNLQLPSQHLNMQYRKLDLEMPKIGFQLYASSPGIAYMVLDQQPWKI